MDRLVGVIAGERIAVGLVEGDQVVSPIRTFPPADLKDAENSDSDHNGVLMMRMEQIAEMIAGHIVELCQQAGVTPGAVGVGFPGIIRDAAVIDESPNLKQAKGSNLKELVTNALGAAGISSRVYVFNDADATAAGLAATRGQLEKFIRVWTLGDGIGLGRYPHAGSVLEGGHMVVSLDPKETYCGCGGKGHLEGIMGHRAMRLRFLDLEPEEVFENAANCDQRCAEFVRLWHRALAAATANCIHLEGSGKFYICGLNSRFVQPVLLNQYLQEFVMMTPLQGSILEVVPSSDEIAIVGAAVNAGKACAV